MGALVPTATRALTGRSKRGVATGDASRLARTRAGAGGGGVPGAMNPRGSPRCRWPAPPPLTPTFLASPKSAITATSSSSRRTFSRLPGGDTQHKGQQGLHCLRGHTAQRGSRDHSARWGKQQKRQQGPHCLRGHRHKGQAGTTAVQGDTQHKGQQGPNCTAGHKCRCASKGPHQGAAGSRCVRTRFQEVGTLMSRWMSFASLEDARPSAVPIAIFTRAGHSRGHPPS